MTHYCMDCEAIDCGCDDVNASAYDVAFDALWNHAAMTQDSILLAFVDLANDCLKSKDSHVVDRAKATMAEALGHYMRNQQRGI